MFLAQERELAEEAFPGDIIGIPNHGNLRIGDTFTEGEDIKITGIPSFAPEILQRVRPLDPLRAKHLGKAVTQLAEEGVARVFRTNIGSNWIVGVVGTLQFDVLADRIRTEYDIPVNFETAPLDTARWLQSDNSQELKRFIDKNPGDLAYDHDDLPVFLARNAWHLQNAVKTWPDIQFFKGKGTVWMTSIPKESDVVIIGGGIIGVSTAYYLAKSGVSVTLVEKGIIAGEQSSRNWGFVRQQGRDPAEIPTIMRSLALWKGLSKELGEDIGFKQAGVFYLANTEEQVAGYEDWLKHAKEYQIDSHIVPKTEIQKYIPTNSGGWLAALRTPSDGKAEPSKATTALARGANNLGANILTNCAVFGFETEAGRVCSVRTELGSIKTNTVLCAGGTWSSLFCGRHNIPLPQLKVRSSVLRTSPAPEISKHSIWCRDVA